MSKQMNLPMEDDEKTHWYVMRDLKRANASLPAYKLLEKEKIEVFTPMKTILIVKQGRRVRKKIPFIQDLLFVHDKRSRLDSIVGKTPTLQYRYVRGGHYQEPMTVPDTDMERFILAVSIAESPRYYTPEEVTPTMCRRKVRIVGSPLDGYVGYLLTILGSKVRRLLVEVKGLLAVGVEVTPEYIQFL